MTISYTKVFSAAYDHFMYFLENNYLKERRARLISGLSGKIFEVGVGTGINLAHYGTQARVTGIEPSPFMLPRALNRRDLLDSPDRFSLRETGCGYPDMEQLFELESLDAVVCTLVLCTVPDPQRALNNFMKWLKPGGRLVVLEHIRSHNHAVGKAQDLFRPLWEKVGDGCQLNRPTDIMVTDSGFQLIREEYFSIGIPFYEAEYIKPADG